MRQEFDFDEIVDRRGTNCAKWDEMDEKYGGTDIIHLGVADMDFRAPQPIMSEIQKVMDHGVFGYTNLNQAFYDSIVGWMDRRFQTTINHESIVFCPRIIIAANLAVQSLTRETDSILIHSPAYAPLHDSITGNHRRIIESPLRFSNGKYEMDFEDMEEKIDESTKMMILCSPHNPTGRVWTRQELERIAAFCEKHDLILFVDEIHSDMVAAGNKHTSILNVSESLNQRTILSSAITKSFNVPGIIISHMVIPNRNIRETMERAIHALGMNNPNSFSVGAVEAAYTKCDEWLKAVNHYVDDNYGMVRTFMENEMPDFKVLDREGTYLAWIDCRSLGLSDMELQRWFIEETRVAVYHGTVFGDSGKGFIRLNLGTSRVLLREALNRMKNKYSTLKS